MQRALSVIVSARKLVEESPILCRINFVDQQASEGIDECFLSLKIAVLETTETYVLSHNSRFSKLIAKKRPVHDLSVRRISRALRGK